MGEICLRRWRFEVGGRKACGVGGIGLRLFEVGGKKMKAMGRWQIEVEV
jgi:hypothetical protein